MRLIYTIGIWFYTLGIRLVALFGHEKARQMVEGWKRWPQEVAKLSHERPTVWFHAASLGEFEQARPVLEEYRRRHPDHQVLVTFFSPSGYEIRKNYALADAICYLPMDTPRNVRRFVFDADPDTVFFVKYEFWYNYLNALKGWGAKTYIFSTIFRPNQYFFKWYGKWFLRQLNLSFIHLFVQNDESLHLLQRHGISHCSKAGDTRFDRVHQIAQAAESNEVAETFLKGYEGKVLVAGSTWPPDEQVLAHVRETNGDWFPGRIILAPHMINEEHLKGIEELFPDSVRYSVLSDGGSQLNTQHSTLNTKKVLIVDNIGLLSKLYRYADVAYIGGGFGVGIHNILEAVTFGKPVFFGPNYQKFQEAHDIIARGGGWSIRGEYDMEEGDFMRLMTHPEVLGKASKECLDYMQENLGSTDIILDTIDSKKSNDDSQPNTQLSTLNTKHLTLNTILSLLLAVLVTSCYTNRYIPEGSYRLDDVKQTVVMADSTEVPPEVKEALKNSENYYVQRRNSKVFGISWLPVGMWIYSVAKPTDSTFWGNYWHRLGQAPIIYEEEKARRTVRQLQGLMETKGCFNSTVTFDTLEIKGKRIAIGYHITATQRYMVDEVIYTTQNDTIRRLLDRWRPASPLKAGSYYDQDVLAAERTRLVSLLREEGYYRASAENITFLVDTTYSPRQLSIEVKVDSRDLRTYRINNIYIFPNSIAGIRNSEVTLDTLPFNYAGLSRQFEFLFVYDTNKTVKPKMETISRSMMMFPGMRYRPSHITNTYNTLLNLRNFKYINIEFTESPSSTESTPMVDAHVRLLNTTQQKISLSLELTNASPIGATDSASNFFSSGNLGIETTLEYQHKNLFGGAELLKVKSSLLLELPKFILQGGGGSFYDNFSTFEVNLDASLDVPDAFPFSSLIFWQRTRPHTLVNLGGSYQYRYWFERILANTAYGYTWSLRSSDLPGATTSPHTTQHQLLPIELTFVRVLNIDDDFANRLSGINDLRLKYQYSSHFIMDARYDFVFSNQQFGTRRNFSVLHLSAESAGNLLKAYSNLTNASSDSNAVHQILGVPFAQYLRFGAEYTHYFYHFQRTTLVTRMLLGAGIPYGNSISMPYEKSFFGGGPTTMRAWQLRHLGPGSYNAGDNMLERVGDLQLVLNLEERFPIAGIFEGALFADMGNVWLLNPSSEYPGGNIEWGEILKEIAVGVGFGLRANVSIVTLRLDFAIPLYDPGYDESYRWRPPHWAFNQIVTNFGINYPF